MIVCPVGTVKDGNVCKAPTISCNAGQFYNTLRGECDFCTFPCSECEGTSTTCTACSSSAGYTLSGTTCVRQINCPAGRYQSGNTCLACPEKCATCSTATICTACNTAAGYIAIGNDCSRNTNQLQPVVLSIVEKTKRGNTVFIKTQANAIPNNLPTNIGSRFFNLVIQPGFENPVATSWVSGTFIYTAMTFNSAIPARM